jgi:hypothetical protein
MMSAAKTVPLVQKRWFALLVGIGLMLIVSVFFALSFRNLSLMERLDLVLTQMAGPIPAVGDLLKHRDFPWSLTVPVSSTVALAAHPAFPNIGTFFVTLMGAFFWWVWGWFAIVAGI